MFSRGELQVLERHKPYPVGSVSAAEGSYQYPENDDCQKAESIEGPDNCSDECLDVKEYDYYYDGIRASSLRNIDQIQGLTRYSTKSIQVLGKLEAYGGGFIVRALVEGRERCVKVFDDLSYHAVQRESTACVKSLGLDTLRHFAHPSSLDSSNRPTMVAKSALSRSIYLMQRRTRCQTWLALATSP